MKEPITKFDLEAAFKALDEIDVPTSGKVKANRPALNEIFSRKTKFDALIEEYYDISDMSELDDAKEAREAEVAQAKLARIEKIVDLDAESPEDLLPSYVGKFIMQCPQCMTLFYKDPEDVEASEEDPNTVNISEVCQHCGNEAGYTLIGKVGEATQEEMAEYTEEETVDVTSTKEDAADEIPEEPSDEDLDLELDELDLDIEDDEAAEEADEDEKKEEDFNERGEYPLVEQLGNESKLHEGAGADTKQIASSIMSKIAEEDKNTWARTAAEILDVIPDEAIDNIVDELGKKFQDFSLSVAEQKEIEAASGGTIPATDKPDTLGKILDAIDPFEQAKKSPGLIKATVSTILAIIGVLEPTPIIELVASVVSTLPAEVIMAVLSMFNPVGLVAAGVNKLYKANKAKKNSGEQEAVDTETNESLTESPSLDVSADEFEQLITSPEFKKPVSDQEAREMMDEFSAEGDETNEALKESHQDDAVYESIYDVFNSGAFISRPGFDRQFEAKRINDSEYKVTQIKTNTSAVVHFNIADESDPTLRFTINGKSFHTLSISEAQMLIAKELAAVRSKQFDLALDESVKVNEVNAELRSSVANQTDPAASETCTNESLAAVMANTDELQEASLEKLISDSLVESYGNVAGFRLADCDYTDDNFTVAGTIYFTSGNARKTSYVFSEALTSTDGKISMRGLNEKLGLEKQFTITGYTDNNRTFITESFTAAKK